jgi:hypothetical protein
MMDKSNFRTFVARFAAAVLSRALSDRRRSAANLPSPMALPAELNASLALLPEPIRAAAAHLVATSWATGIGAERARLDAIMSLPSARGDTVRAWEIARSGDFTPAEADAALRTAAVDVVVAVGAAGAERQITIH